MYEGQYNLPQSSGNQLNFLKTSPLRFCSLHNRALGKAASSYEGAAKGFRAKSGRVTLLLLQHLAYEMKDIGILSNSLSQLCWNLSNLSLALLNVYL